MPISFRPMRSYMKENQISYYYLSNQGIDPQTLQRIRHDKTITTETLAELCSILNCAPEQLIEFVSDTEIQDI